MKILILCNYASGLLTFRGMLIERLLAKGHTVYAVVPQTGEEKELLAQRELERLGCGLYQVSMERRGMNPLKDIKLFFAYRRILRAATPDFAITYTIKPNIYGGLACRLARLPYAANITGLGTAFQNPGMLRALVTALYKPALKKAKVIFFENEENRETIVAAGIAERRRTHVLAGAGVDLARFALAAYPKERTETSFLFVGRVMREKGVEELFQAMELLRKDGLPCALHILGSFEEDYAQRLKRYEAEGWLYYHGYQNDVRPFIANCHCFVLPSWHEGMANTNLECAAMGRPVITSEIHGCLEAVVDGKSGLLCRAKDASSLYAAMKKLAQMPDDQRAAMGEAGRRHMEAVFDKRKVVETTLKVMGV